MNKDILEFWDIDLDEVKKRIDKSLDLTSDQAFFEYLTSITALKSTIKDTLETVEKYEREAKGLINSRAKKLYGDDWQAIKGDKFKITRSKTGSMYLVNGKPNKKFIKTKVSANSEEIEAFLVANDTLPAGIEINDQRGESLRITLK